MAQHCFHMTWKHLCRSGGEGHATDWRCAAAIDSTGRSVHGCCIWSWNQACSAYARDHWAHAEWRHCSSGKCFRFRQAVSELQLVKRVNITVQLLSAPCTDCDWDELAPAKHFPKGISWDGSWSCTDPKCASVACTSCHHVLLFEFVQPQNLLVTVQQEHCIHLVLFADDFHLLSQVAMGASHAVAPDGQVYILKWVQDDNGRLHLQDHKLDTLTDYSGGAEWKNRIVSCLGCHPGSAPCVV